MWVTKKYFLILVFATTLMACRHEKSSEAEGFTRTAQHIATEILPATAKSQLAHLFEKSGLVDVCAMDSSLKVDLKYAGKDNFMGMVLYDTLATIYLHPEIAKKLIRAQLLLKNRDHSLSLVVWDASRPLRIQRKMYENVAGTPFQHYVASPDRTGLHNYGCAVDLSICQSDGKLLDMGTPFDFFGKKAAIRNEQALVREGLLSQDQVDNRLLLRQVMLQAGFLTVGGEWWHFNGCSLREAKAKYRLIQ